MLLQNLAFTMLFTFVSLSSVRKVFIFVSLITLNYVNVLLVIHITLLNVNEKYLRSAKWLRNEMDSMRTRTTQTCET